MSSSDSIEVTAATVDAAISSALEQLGAEQDDVTIEVLSTPRSGVLGLGARQARVRVTRRAPEGARSGVTSPPPAPPARPKPSRGAPPPSRPARQQPAGRSVPAPAKPVVREHAEAPEESEERPARAAASRSSADLANQASEATAILARILELMGEKAEIELSNEAEPDTVELSVKGDGSGLLIGRHGQTLDALEYLVNRALARKIKDAAPISIDTESYRLRRRQQLHRMALSKGEQAKREHVQVTLEPMPPRDRRIVHLALKDDPLITTRSAGDGFLRAIQIVPVDERREGAGPRAGGERRRDRDRDRGRTGEGPEPLGQQGGFKHGQKRIV